MGGDFICFLKMRSIHQCVDWATNTWRNPQIIIKKASRGLHHAQKQCINIALHSQQQPNQRASDWFTIMNNPILFFYSEWWSRCIQKFGESNQSTSSDRWRSLERSLPSGWRQMNIPLFSDPIFIDSGPLLLWSVVDPDSISLFSFDLNKWKGLFNVLNAHEVHQTELPKKSELQKSSKLICFQSPSLVFSTQDIFVRVLLQQCTLARTRWLLQGCNGGRKKDRCIFGEKFHVSAITIPIQITKLGWDVLAVCTYTCLQASRDWTE